MFHVDLHLYSQKEPYLMYVHKKIKPFLEPHSKRTLSSSQKKERERERIFLTL
jgi:hypothetical protein